MNLETALRWSWLNVLTSKRAEALINVHGGLDAAIDDLSLEMLRALGCKEETAITAMNRDEEFDVDAYKEALRKREIQFVTCEDDAYPIALKTLPDYPLFLYAKGDLAVLDQPCLALVGTREMSDYGKRITAHLVHELTRSGLITVSGLAYGIDAEVAKETMRTGGKTVAVLGHGLGMIYPKANEKLSKEIVAHGGLLLAEFPLDIGPDKFTFPARNRIIAGLTLGTVVIEATADSGSLITANLALEYGREVFAVPGQIFDEHFAGCHQLIARGQAKLVTNADDILQELGMISRETPMQIKLFKTDSPEEQAIFSALTAMPADLDDLAVKTKLTAATIGATLTVLELKSAAKNIGGGRWVRA